MKVIVTFMVFSAVAFTLFQIALAWTTSLGL